MVSITTDATLVGMLSVTAVRSFSPHFGFNRADFERWDKVFTFDRARQMHETGEKYSLLVGLPENPDLQIEVFKAAPNGYRRIDVHYYRDLVRTRLYILAQREQHGSDDLLLVEYKSHPGTDGDRFYYLFVADAFVDGDLPTFGFDEIGVRGEYHAISVPWQDFFLGPFPSFDELIDGRFLARLPPITIPPRELWETYVPQIERTPTSPPKRTPRGRFPW
jgi:hypothetical protein